MFKKLPLLCASLATAGFLAAIGLAEEKDQALTVPEAAQKTVTAAPKLVKLGAAKNVPNRAPDGGYTPPVTFVPTQEQFNECTILDLNGDSKTWSYDNGTFKYTYHASNQGDDWCILPAMNLEAATYKVSYTYYTKSYPESFRICLGTSVDPESMTVTLLDKENYKNTDAVTETTTVEITAAGEYHFGLYAYSQKNQFYAYIKNISIEKLDMSMPKSPTLEIDPVALDCTLTVTLPTTNIGDEPLTGDLTAVVTMDDVTIDGGTYTAAPGDVKTFNITVPNSGYHTFKATVTSGDVTSEPGVASHKFSKAQPVPIPMGYVFEPDEDEFDWCTVINSNNDPSTWKWMNSGYIGAETLHQGTFCYPYAMSYDADDWIILPAFDGTEGGAHMLKFGVATKYDLEGLEVGVAYEPTVEALSQNIIYNNTALKYIDGGFDPQEVIFSTEAGKNFYVAFHAISERYKSYIYINGVSVELTDGSIPAKAILSDDDFDGGEGTVKLTFPTVDMSGADLDASSTVYADITLDGETYGDAVSGNPGQTTTLSFSGLSLGEHTLTATTYWLDGDQKNGNQTTTFKFRIRISSSFSYQLPAEMMFNLETYDNYKVIDANEDGTTWTGKTEWIEYNYSRENAADDWIFTPAIEITEPGMLYDIAITLMGAIYYDEFIEAYIGQAQTVEAMTIEALPNTTVKGANWADYEHTFSIAEPGRYYVGIHCTSEKDKGTLKLKKLTLGYSASVTASPAAVTNLTATGKSNGDLMADVTFNMPAVTFGGDPIDAETTLTATVVSAEETKTIEGTPGQELSLTIACPRGESEIKVSVSSEEGTGLAATTQVVCGLGQPAAPQITALTVSEDNMSVKIDYAAVTSVVSTGVVNAEGMDYYLWEWDEEDEDWYQVDVVDALSMTYTVDNPNVQTGLTLGIQASNGLNSFSSMTSFTVVLGKPYDLPMNEDFAQGKLHYSPLMLGSSLSSDYAPQWSMVDPTTIFTTAVSPTGTPALYGHTSFNRGDTYLYLPKFSTKNIEDAQIELTSYQTNAGCELTFLAAGYGMDQYSVLGSVAVPTTTEGWKTLTYPLPTELQNSDWVEAVIYVNFVGGSNSKPLFDSYVIRSASQSGVENVTAQDAAAGTVEGLTGAIAVKGFAGNTARIFTPAGQQAATVTLAGDNVTVPVAAGIYIVTVADKTFKVAVD